LLLSHSLYVHNHSPMAKPITHTLRFRLTVWNTVVLLLASLLALLAVREGMRWTLETETKVLLREEATELEMAVIELSPDTEAIKAEFQRKIAGHQRHGWFARLQDANGQAIWTSTAFPDAKALSSRQTNGQTNRQTNGEDKFFFQRSSDFLWVEHTVHPSDQIDFQITFGTPLSFIENDVWNLSKIVFAIGAVLIFVAPIGGFVLARNATQPVREIIETTRSLDPENLKTRLAIRGTGDELDQISTEINSFVDQISNYLRIHREFIANAAHELRSPLTAIQTSVEVTLDKERTNQEYREELETVSEQCEHLRHLVNQLLQLAETDISGVDRQKSPVCLSEVVQQSVDFFRGIAEEEGISLKTNLQANIVIAGDSLKLHQVVNNLLDNSLKFTPRGGAVDIVLTQSHNQIALSVLDSGSGIPKELLCRVFERFYQIEPSRQRTDRRGNGLGLSICKSVVQWHDGEIQICNRPTGGTAVTVTFVSPER